MSRLILSWIAYWTLFTAFVEGSFYYPRYPSCEPKYSYPLVRNKPFPYETLVPVAFYSSTAVAVSVPPYEIEIFANDWMVIKNDGNNVEFLPYNNCTVGTVKGGPVYNNRYRFIHIDYGCDGVPNNTRNTDSLDGASKPIQFLISFYKEEYGSYSESLKHRDGIVAMAIPVGVYGTVDNPAFVPMQKALEKIKQPNTTSYISSYNALYWLFRTLSTGTPYYSYPGGYRASPGAVSFCTVDIHPNFDICPWISYKQFECFLEILDQYGAPQVAASAVHAMGDRPFVECCGPIYVKYKK